jgi:diacylglycerol diphosphate phosphatase/phosphatidate phosphatase
MWKLIATYAPILGATLIAGALTIDEYHNWYDCVAGAIIGTIMAFSAYRMVYASIWDWRINHIPLNRAVPFPGTGAGVELQHAVFTRQAGWGYENTSHFGGHHDGNIVGNSGNFTGGRNYATGSTPSRKPVIGAAANGHYVPQNSENMV